MAKVRGVSDRSDDHQTTTVRRAETHQSTLHATRNTQQHTRAQQSTHDTALLTRCSHRRRK